MFQQQQQRAHIGGNILLTEEEQKARWMEHFQEVLNQPDLTVMLDLGNDVPREQISLKST